MGLFLCWTAYDSAEGDFSAHGPWLAPLVVTAGWVVLSAWYLVSQFVRPANPTDAAATTVEPTDGADPALRSETVHEPAPVAGTAPADKEPGAGTELADGTNLPDGTELVDETEATGPVQWLTPALLGVALLGYVLLLDPVGFVLASAVFFVAAARILGSHHSIRDVLVAVPLVLGIYLGFTHLLEISLPSGVLPL
ncbi:tripartite tricarboxylate transporter TctB family protein [Micromonospora sp. NPDC049523]|uniref:tripartite tricarboxylate transporter TctB family protein n=1 Tax=Micromonospora sp. NPDC049523 TaxID=3155921 RepID=UPI0034232214